MGYMEEYKSWLTRFAADEETIAELKSIENDEKEIEDRFYTSLAFGTGGLRGVLGMGTNRMNVYNVRRATMGLAQYVKAHGTEHKGVVVAYDSRIKSDVFAKETALTLAAAGIKAYLFESLRPVPILSYSVRHLGTAAGVIITASHNPPQYNGYKVYGEDGAQIGPDVADEIIASMKFSGVNPQRYGTASTCTTTWLIVLVAVLFVIVALLAFFLIRFSVFAKASGSEFNIIGFNFPKKN